MNSRKKYYWVQPKRGCIIKHFCLFQTAHPRKIVQLAIHCSVIKASLRWSAHKTPAAAVKQRKSNLNKFPAELFSKSDKTIKSYLPKIKTSCLRLVWFDKICKTVQQAVFYSPFSVFYSICCTTIVLCAMRWQQLILDRPSVRLAYIVVPYVINASYIWGKIRVF
jgi:hypothetical protein